MKILVGIKSLKKLNTLTADFTLLKELSRVTNCNGYFVFTFDSDNPEILTHGRMFAPAIGINEDPVIGMANGPLGAYIVHHKLVEFGGKLFDYKAQQGQAIGRTGVVEVSVSIKNDEPIKVEVGGNAVIVFKTTIQI